MPASNVDAVTDLDAIDSFTLTLDRRDKDRRDPSPSVSRSDGKATDPQEVKSRTKPAEPSKRKTQRRRHIDPTTCEREYSEPEIEFMRAMDDYKQSSGRMFPTCSEVLEVLRSLGYVQLNDEQFAALGLDENADCDPETPALSEEEADELLEA